MTKLDLLSWKFELHHVSAAIDSEFIRVLGCLPSSPRSYIAWEFAALTLVSETVDTRGLRHQVEHEIVVEVELSDI